MKFKGDKRKAAFIAAYAECGGSITNAAKSVGVNRATPYGWLKDDPDFAQALEEAKAQAVEVLETEAIRRAVEGVEEPYYQRGQVVGSVRRYSDNLLMFLLRGMAPQKYRDRSSVEVEVTPEWVRQAAQELGIDPEAAVTEAEKIIAETVKRFRK